jgi:hypothetical protein
MHRSGGTILLAVAALIVLAAGRTPPDVSGIYDTRVSLLESSCTLEVRSNPTEVAQYGDSVVTLRHAGTTYQGVLAADGSFRTEPKVLDFNGTRYEITITGRFTGAALTARVVLRYGDPPCQAVVLWEGPRRASHRAD